MTAFNCYSKLLCDLRNSTHLFLPNPSCPILSQVDKMICLSMLSTQHASTRKVTLTSLLRSSSLRLHLQASDTCFQILVMSEHMANNTITALTCQLTDIICAPFSAEAAENIVCISQNSRSY